MRSFNSNHHFVETDSYWRSWCDARSVRKVSSTRIWPSTKCLRNFLDRFLLINLIVVLSRETWPNRAHQLPEELKAKNAHINSLRNWRRGTRASTPWGIEGEERAHPLREELKRWRATGARGAASEAFGSYWSTFVQFTELGQLDEASCQSQMTKSYWEHADSTIQCGMRRLIALWSAHHGEQETTLLFACNGNQQTQRTISNDRNQFVFRFNLLCKEDKVRGLILIKTKNFLPGNRFEVFVAWNPCGSGQISPLCLKLTSLE